MAKSNSPTSPNQQFDDRKEHYDALITLFKYAITSLTLVITVTGIFVGYTTYTDGKEMRTAMREQEKVLQQNLMDLNEKELDMQKALVDLIRSTREDVSITGQRAINQINSIKDESTSVARIEAKKRIEQVFEDNNIEDFIVTVAKERLEPQVEKIVDDRFSNTKRLKFEKAISDMSSKDEWKQQLALLYFQNTDPSEWSDNQLITVTNALKKLDEGTFLKSDVCIYIALTKSPVVEEFFESELVGNPVGDIANMGFSHVINNKGTSALEIYLKSYKKVPIDKRPNFYLRLIMAANSTGDNTITTACLNFQKIIDLLFVDMEQLEKQQLNHMASIKESIKSLLNDKPNFQEIQKSYFFTKTYPN